MPGLVSQALAPFTLKGFYLVSWGAALGTNLWHSLSALKAYQTLDAANFSKLQGELQPAYFTTSTILTSSLLATHLYFHPVLLSSPLKAPHWWQLEEGVQGLLIVAALVPQLINLLVVGPKAAKAKIQRSDVEKAEGKAYNASNPSESMKAANSKFALLHGVATWLNNTSLLALVGLGLAVSM